MNYYSWLQLLYQAVNTLMKYTLRSHCVRPATSNLVRVEIISRLKIIFLYSKSRASFHEWSLQMMFSAIWYLTHHINWARVTRYMTSLLHHRWCTRHPQNKRIKSLKYYKHILSRNSFNYFIIIQVWLNSRKVTSIFRHKISKS